MPTIVGILTFISMINTPSERLKEINVFIICQYFSFYEQLKFRAQLSCKMIKKSFITSGPVLDKAGLKTVSSAKETNKKI